MKVRLRCMSRRRGPKNGIPAPSTCARSITSPVLISLTASRTTAGFIRLPEPRSSPAPHFDGQRALSDGTVHDGACARAVVLAISTAPIANAMHFMAFLPSSRCRTPVRPGKHAPCRRGPQRETFGQFGSHPRRSLRLGLARLLLRLLALAGRGQRVLLRLAPVEPPELVAGDGVGELGVGRPPRRPGHRRGGVPVHLVRL